MRNHRTNAFTLIELLVVIAIIAILAALLLPALSRAKERGYRTQCTHDLKQFAIAAQLYADDHGDQLPGPVWQGFYETYDNQDTTRLLYYLATYLGQPAPSPTPQTSLLARCPSASHHWRNASSGADPMSLARPLSYIVSVAVTNINSDIVTRPFGYPRDYALPQYTSVKEAPKRLREIGNPSLSWAVTDADKQNAVPVAGYYAFLPSTPTHGTVRNKLFFDWHVDTVKN